jgi:prepilin-type N-terminal cleavage/methylation domain-containing protein
MHITARSKSLKAGFTLIEILMVISIIMLMTGALLPSFTNYLERQTLIQGVELFKSDIRTIQNKAMAGSAADVEVVVSGSVYETPDYWVIQFRDGDPSNYYGLISFEVSSEVCNEDSPNPPSTDPPTKKAKIFDTLKLPPNFSHTINNGPGNSCIFISMRNGDIHTINFSGQDDTYTDISEDTACITLSSSEINTDVQVTVNPFGLVESATGTCP